MHFKANHYSFVSCRRRIPEASIWVCPASLPYLANYFKRQVLQYVLLNKVCISPC